MEKAFICKATSNFIQVRGLKFHYLSWGNPDKPTLIMLHGFMDHAHTFDLLAEYFSENYHIIAWDARGFGSTEHIPENGYYFFLDYILDLELFLEALKIKEPVIIGHSMGGMISSMYAGVYPEKVKILVNMEGWILQTFQFSDAPPRTRQWIEQIKAGSSFGEMNSTEEAKLRLLKNDPYIPEDFALHLAETGTVKKNGKYIWRHDPVHKTRSPQPTYLGQIEAFWDKIECPVLLLRGESGFSAEDQEERISHFKNKSYFEIEKAGHNLHINNPQKVAEKIISFIRKQ